MVKHIVCFKLKDGESALKAKEVLLSMQGKVPTAKSISVNIDELKSARSFDIILEVLLDDFKALDEYQVDPYHCEVVKTHMHAVMEKSIALDFTV
ncbi:MAG: Dabb family protein [Clostridia bacterium]|nr:Dabb family protein [Clostridia bacterium]